MYQTIEAVWKEGRIVPLEPIAAEENTPLIVTVLKPPPPSEPGVDPERLAKIRALKGSMRGQLSSVDEFIARKQEEIELEERR
jgi:hypothetical protein